MILKFRRFLKAYFTKNERGSSLYNLGYSGEAQKRVLFSYLTDSFSSKHKYYTNVSNRKECQLILTCLIKLGYEVDVVDCRYKFDYTGIDYDLVIGFGDAFRNAKLRNGGSRVLYLTEGPPKFSLKNEIDRLNYFFKRHPHNQIAKIERSGSYYKDEDIVNADCIITMGELHQENLYQTYKKEHVYDFFPLGLPVKSLKKVFRPSKNILWFGSRGFIHKGLDIIIDSIANLPDWTLHVCGAEKRQLEKIVKVPKNVAFYGVVDVDGNEFESLVQLCNFSFLLSASEATPTSVLTAMRAGLIPVVSGNIGVKLDEAIVLDSYLLEDVQQGIVETYNFSEEQIYTMSESVKNEVNSRFNEKGFIKGFSAIINKVESL